MRCSVPQCGMPADQLVSWWISHDGTPIGNRVPMCEMHTHWHQEMLLRNEEWTVILSVPIAWYVREPAAAW